MEDTEVLRQAHEYAHEAKLLRQYTDVQKFCLKCNDCDALLTGQVEAQLHAKSTGHKNFSEL